jgi:hypothetical protein
MNAYCPVCTTKHKTMKMKLHKDIYSCGCGYSISSKSYSKFYSQLSETEVIAKFSKFAPTGFN